MDERRPNNWVRFQVGVLTLLLLATVVYRLFKANPPAQFDGWSIILLLLATVLILSEAFDNFSIGKIISISREVQKKEKEVQKLETSNERLFSQLMSVTTNQSQAMTHTHVYGDYHAGRVEAASPEEIEESREREVGDQSQSGESSEPNGPTGRPAPRRFISPRKIDDLGMQLYADMRSVDRSMLIRDAKLVTDFQNLDGISNHSIIFDGYMRGLGMETFVEVRSKNVNPMIRDRIYMMLSKIMHYGMKNNRKAKLDLVFLDFPSRGGRPSFFDRLKVDFEPAIASGLLNIIELEVSEEAEEALFD